MVLIIFHGCAGSNSVDKYFQLLDEGKQEEASELFSSKIEGTVDSENIVREQAIDMIIKTKEDYYEKIISYEEAINELAAFSKLEIVSNDFKQARDFINELNKSRIAYEEAIEYEEDRKYLDAIRKYRSVIEEDENYESSRQKIQSLTVLYKKNVIDEAEGYANKNDFTKALTTILSAQKFIGEDKELIAKVDKYNGLIKESQKLFPGKVIDDGKFTLEYVKASLTTSIKPDSLGRFYLYYSADNDEIFLNLVFKLSNKSTHSLKIEDILSDVNVTYNSSYNFSRFSTYYSQGSDIDPTYSWSSIDPLKRVTYHLAVRLPREVTSTTYPIEINFSALGEKQFLQFR